MESGHGMLDSLSQIPPERRPSMMLSNSAPACVSEERGAALMVIKRYLLFYLKLPNYQNYFVEAGYEEEVMAARTAIANGDDESLRAAISERMASEVALLGTKAEVLEKPKPGLRQVSPTSCSTPPPRAAIISRLPTRL
jgi:hypothetical protein